MNNTVIHDVERPVTWKYKTIIQKSAGLDYQLADLHKHMVTITPTMNLLKAEYFILKKITYLNKNSQRQHKFFQLLSQISHLLQKVMGLDCLKTVLCLTTSNNDSLTPFHTYLPTRKAIEYSLAEVMVTSSIMMRLLGVCLKAYQFLKYNIYRAFVMDKQLIYVALVARIWTLSRRIVSDFGFGYTGLLSALKAHPKFKGHVMNTNITGDWRLWLASSFPDSHELIEMKDTDVSTNKKALLSGSGKDSKVVIKEDLGDIIDRELLAKITKRSYDDTDAPSKADKSHTFLKKLQTFEINVNKLPGLVKSSKKLTNKSIVLSVTRMLKKEISVALNKYDATKATRVEMEVIRRKCKAAFSGLLEWAKYQPQSKVTNAVRALKNDLEKF